MKKILLFMAMAFFAIVSFAQENPCPTVTGVRKTNQVNNGNGTCTATITLHLTNDVSNSNPKGVTVDVFCGPISGNPIVSNCFLASTLPGGEDFTTSPFTCPCGSPVNIRITRHTASNGSCQGGTCGTVIFIQESPLQVSLVSFDANRNRSMVSLSWETSFEQNNTGFSVERRIGTGSWQEVAFVPSQANGGNSNGNLHYEYSDLNSTKGISEYRLKQSDFDARTSYSEIRAVRGEGQSVKSIVFPNPSQDGSVTIVFGGSDNTRDVVLMDMSGRMIRQWKAVKNNNLKIDNLVQGMYTLRVTIPETGEQTVDKIVVSKH